jgi:hypothetical protein
MLKMQIFKLLRKVKIITALFCVVTILMIFSGLISCQKVISIDLNSASPQLVVEGNLSDLPGPYFVRLSKTVNFNEITQIPAVTGADIVISDSTAGTHETLVELKDGVYMTSALQGIPGHKYKLKIETEGQTYEADSKMPYSTGPFKLVIKSEADNESSSGGGNGDKTVRYRVYYEISDPAEYINYYRFVISHQNREISSRRVFSDQYHNGKIIADDFILRDTIDFNPGDTIGITLENIDRNTYNFFRTLREGAGGLSFLSASPSNPISNITNNGLGYFSANTLVREYVIIPR